MTGTKHRDSGTEPDNKVMKVVQFNAGYAPVDVLVVELKCPQEKNSFDASNRVARNLLDDHMHVSSNWPDTTLFGAISIGTYVQFYEKVLPGGPLVSHHSEPLHLENDAVIIRGYFDYFNANVPREPTSLATTTAASTSTCAATTSATTSAATSATCIAPEGSSQGSMPDQYYYVEDSQHFNNNNRSATIVEQYPRREWVYNAKGRSDTGRTKFWRYWDGKKISYE